MTNRKIFTDIFNQKIKREGSKELLKWLEEKTDFFTAPASTKYHCAHEGGLLEHSLNVYKFYRQEMAQRAKLFSGTQIDKNTEESIAICALLHDICKVNYYVVDHKNQKNAKGEWEKVPYYKVNDQFPYGHGEKSVWLIERFMRLNVEETIAIRWHMGGFDDAVKGGSFALSKAYEDYPSALLLHIADMKANFMLDTK